MTSRGSPRGPPRALGYRMPGEWHPHAATWIAWPHERSDWPGCFAAIPRAYVRIVAELARGERVEVVVPSRSAEDRIRHRLGREDVPLERVRFHRWPTDRSWLRDSGPTFVVRPNRGTRAASVGAVRWRFNAWAKYDNWHRDARVAGRIARTAAVPSWAARARGRRLVLEGGAIDADGQGLLLTTEECLLGSEQARNPGLSRADLETAFAAYLGIGRVLWLPGGLAGDDTHGHVDDVARFVAPASIVAATAEDPADPNHAMLTANRARLEAIAATARPTISVAELPMPSPIRFRGAPLPASYANFYVANDSVLVPTFDDPMDGRALAVLARCFPGRRVTGIPARDLVVGLGTLHCLTQPEFAAAGGARRGAGRKFK